MGAPVLPQAPLPLRPVHWDPTDLSRDQGPERADTPGSRLSLRRELFAFPAAPPVLEAPTPFPPQPCLKRKDQHFLCLSPALSLSLSLSLFISHVSHRPLSICLWVSQSLCHSLSPALCLSAYISPSPFSIYLCLSLSVSLVCPSFQSLPLSQPLCLSVSPSLCLSDSFFLSLFKFQSNPLND